MSWKTAIATTSPGREESLPSGRSALKEDEEQAKPGLRRQDSKLEDVAYAALAGQRQLKKSRTNIQIYKDAEDPSLMTNVSAEMMHDLYVARSQDVDERTTKEGLRVFRDGIEPSCRAQNFIVRSMRLGYNACNVILRALRHIQVSITRVDLYRNFIRDQGLYAILELVRANPDIEILNVGCNGIEHHGGIAVAEELEQNQSLVQLEIGSDADLARLENRIDNQACVQIAESLRQNKTLRFLGMSRNVLVPEGSKKGQVDKTAAYYVLAKTLRHNKTLDVLRLASTHIGTVGGIVIVESLLKNKTLWHLDLSENGLGSEAGKAIGHMLERNQSLAVLLLQKNKLSGVGAKSIGMGLKLNNTLVHIDIEGNNIQDLGACYLADALTTNRTVTSLNLSNNGITEVGGVALAHAVGENNVLQTLQMNRNVLRDATAVALADALQSHKSLHLLELIGCRIGDDGTSCIAAAMKYNNTMLVLRMKDNHISEAGGKVVAQSLHHNTTLKQIALQGNQVDHSALLHVKKICARNRAATKTALATPLKQEIVRLRLLQNELVDAKRNLVRINEWIASSEKEMEDTLQAMEMVEEDRKIAVEKSTKQLELNQAALAESKKKLKDKEEEMKKLEEEFTEQMKEVDEKLAEAAKKKKELTDALETVTKNAQNPDQVQKDRAAQYAKELEECKLEKERVMEETDQVKIEANVVKNKIVEMEKQRLQESQENPEEKEEKKEDPKAKKGKGSAKKTKKGKAKA